MKLLLVSLLSVFSAAAQNIPDSVPVQKMEQKWRINKNKILTGSLIFLAGASKGFNETLTFHFKTFHQKFPNANPQWFNPSISWRNKYRNGDRSQGNRFFLSNTVLVMTTDQYHLNNFINRASWIAAIVLKIGEPKKSFKYYMKDLLYYTVCNQLGFYLTYYPFAMPAKK